MDPLLTIPVGSIATLSTEQSLTYAKQLSAINSRSVRDMITSSKSGAFIRGLTKTYNVPLEQAPRIALMILQIALGEKSLPQLTNLLSVELQIPNTMAQKMAGEIEQELFAPIMLELNQYLTQQQKPATAPQQPSNLSAGGARNVLDLKNKPQPPTPPPIPRQ